MTNETTASARPALSTEREAFEAAMRQEGMNDRELEKNEHGKYVDLTTGWAYAAWQARAALSAPAPITAERDAYKWAYEYLQSRMESIDRHGWAHDCDGEIEDRIKAAAITKASS